LREVSISLFFLAHLLFSPAVLSDAIMEIELRTHIQNEDKKCLCVVSMMLM